MPGAHGHVRTHGLVVVLGDRSPIRNDMVLHCLSSRGNPISEGPLLQTKRSEQWKRFWEPLC